jgi:tetrahydromethanopterin S-methyltransferase subunit G
LPNSIENLGSQILERLATIESQVTTVKNHASQNGGWVKINESLNAISEKVDEIDKKICDPEEGVIARLRDVEQWQRDSEMKLGSENQNNRMIKIETDFKLHEQRLSMMSKLGWLATSTVFALVIKTVFDLIQ